MPFLVLIAVLATFPAYAYVGPGPGLSMMGSLFGVVASVVVALVMVLLWPIRLLWQRIRSRKTPDA